MTRRSDDLAAADGQGTAAAETFAAVVASWLARLERALARSDDALLESLFHPDSHWRDLLALTWRIGTVGGAGAIVEGLRAHVGRARPTDFQIDPDRTVPRWVTRAGTEAIEAIFRFETALGRASGVLRLTEGGQGLKAWTLLTALDELKGFEERVGRARPSGERYSRDFRGPNWLDLRKQAAAYADREPAVLVVGGGQAGLSIAARLTHLGVDTLVVDRWPTANRGKAGTSSSSAPATAATTSPRTCIRAAPGSRWYSAARR
jgi:putative flavoprotein involved in K+ transport